MNNIKWCDQKEVHTGFVKMAGTRTASIECMGCDADLEGKKYWYDVKQAEIICDVCHLARTEKPAKASRPKVPGEPAKKRGKKTTNVDSEEV